MLYRESGFSTLIIKRFFFKNWIPCLWASGIQSVQIKKTTNSILRSVWHLRVDWNPIGDREPVGGSSSLFQHLGTKRNTQRIQYHWASLVCEQISSSCSLSVKGTNDSSTDGIDGGFGSSSINGRDEWVKVNQARIIVVFSSNFQLAPLRERLPPKEFQQSWRCCRCCKWTIFLRMGF